MTATGEPAGATVERLNRVLADLGADCLAGYRHGGYYLRCRTPEGLVRVGYLSGNRVLEDESQLRRTLREAVDGLMSPGWRSRAKQRRVRRGS